MKQKIYIPGLITTSIIVTGSLFKISHLAGAGFLLALGVVSLIFAFLPLALRNHFRTEGNRKNLVLYIVTWLTSFVIFMGMLFKIMHWPGAGIALIISLPFPYVVFLPVFIASTAKDKSFDINNTVAVLCLLAVVSIFSALLALNVSKEKIVDSMEFSANYNRIEAALDEIPSPVVQTPVTDEIDDLLETVNDYQNMILASEGMTMQQWKDDPWLLKRPEDANVAGRSSLVYGRGKHSGSDLRLQNGLGDLIRELNKSAASEEATGNVPLIFDYSETPGEKFGWTIDKLIVSPGVWTMVYLDGLATNLKLLRASGI